MGQPMFGHVQRRHTHSDSAGKITGMVWMLTGSVLDAVHIGATWRIRLNRPCPVAMQPYVKLL